MLAIAAFYLSLLLSVALGFPLSERDVINPHITNPKNGTVWVVGAKETVTWDTSDLPPDSQITNPTGRLILGHLANGSENLQLEHPLAQNFKLRDGRVTITVPDVPDRDDYIVVLMGDSGNASPTFVIASISKGSTVRAVTTSALITSAIPIIGSQITGSATTEDVGSTSAIPITGSQITGSVTTEDVGSTSASAPETTATAPTSSIALPSSQTPSQGGTAAPASASNSAAWSIHHLRLWYIISAPLVLASLV